MEEKITLKITPSRNNFRKATMSIENLNYYNDPRVRGAARANRGDSATDPQGNDCIKFSVEIDHEDGSVEEVVHLLPAKYAECSVCGGKGTHVNPSVDCGGLTREDFGRDPSFEKSYRSGAHDVTCYTCKGKRVELIVDESRCDKDILKRYQDDLQQQAWDDEVSAQERRMGA